MDRISEDGQAPGLEEARQKLIYHNMSAAERHAYDEHLSAMMIQNDVLDGAKLEGRMEGRMEECISNARKMKAKGLDTAIISDITGLSNEEIDGLQP